MAVGLPLGDSSPNEYGVFDDEDEGVEGPEEQGHTSPPAFPEARGRRPREVKTLVSASWRRRKNYWLILQMFLGQRGVIRRRGAGGGPQGPGRVPPAA